MSGGADSVALLLGLDRLAPEFGYRLAAAHLHHGLRGREADADLEAVRALCRRLQVPLTAARWDCRSRMARLGLSGQAGLRSLRRSFLRRAARRAGAEAIATGHTADDQLETVLMRLVRGTGLAGLGGMCERRGRWLKPLLAASRAEVEADLLAVGETWREDRSNDEPRYVRGRIRNEVIPALIGAAETGGGAAGRVAARGATAAARGRAAMARAALARRFATTTREVRSARRVVERLATRVARRTATVRAGRITLDPRPLRSYPLAIQRAVLRMLWRRAGNRDGLTRRHLGALQSLAESPAGRATVDLPRGWRAQRSRNRLFIGKMTAVSPAQSGAR